ncbi:MAG: peptide-methionine (S)-S-oxide reductase MsrA [Maricaulaceae bacterium]
MKNLVSLLAISFVAACSFSPSPQAQTETETNIPQPPATKNTASAIFAGGCFWCVESDFEKLPGVIEAVSGYTGGTTKNPTYKEVTYKDTGHYEAAKIIYDPSVVSYEELLAYYWTTVDPTDPHGQFCDKGDSYRTAIFANAEQFEAAESSKASIKQTKPFKAAIVTPVLKAQTFYDAEGYHQNYYKKNPIRYKYYRNGCRRDARLKQLWGAK